MTRTAPASELAFSRTADQPSRIEQAERLIGDNLPEFMGWESPGNWRWHRVYDLFPQWQLCLLEPTGSVLAAANAVPLRLDGTRSALPSGYDEVLVAVVDGDMALSPDTLCLLSISLAPRLRGQGVAARIIRELRSRAGQAGLASMVAPLRPTRKQHYPLIPMADYVHWTTPSGAPFDPWLRTHLELGAEIVGIADRSIVIEQPTSRWESATGLSMPGPGSYVVAGALAPVRRDQDGSATYAEPNVWLRHPVPG